MRMVQDNSRAVVYMVMNSVSVKGWNILDHQSLKMDPVALVEGCSALELTCKCFTQLRYVACGVAVVIRTVDLSFSFVETYNKLCKVSALIRN
jgi:hypothetical protein